MGSAVSGAVEPFKEAVSNAVEGVKDIASGDIGGGLKQIGQGAVDTVKATIYESGVGAAKGAIGDFKANPAGAISQAVQAVGSGGATLIPSLTSAAGSVLNEAGSSVLNYAMGLSPAQLQQASLPRQAPVSAPMLPQTGGSNILLPILFIGAVAAIIYFRR